MRTAQLDRCRAHLQPVPYLSHRCRAHLEKLPARYHPCMLPERPFRLDHALTSHATKFVSAAPFNSNQILRGATPTKQTNSVARARAATTSPSHATKFVSAAPSNSIQIVEGAAPTKQTNSVARCSGGLLKRISGFRRRRKEEDKRNTFHRASCSSVSHVSEKESLQRFQRRCRR